MSNFAETNFFTALQANSPSTIQADVDDTIGDGEVRAVSMGRSGLDFIPSKNSGIKLSTDRKPPADTEKVEVVRSDVDFLTHEQTAKRRTVRGKLVEQAARNIVKEYEPAIERYKRAKAFVLKWDNAPNIDPTNAKRLKKAKSLVAKGSPMTLEKAMLQARRAI